GVIHRLHGRLMADALRDHVQDAGNHQPEHNILGHVVQGTPLPVDADLRAWHFATHHRTYTIFRPVPSRYVSGERGRLAAGLRVTSLSNPCWSSRRYSSTPSPWNILVR